MLLTDIGSYNAANEIQAHGFAEMSIDASFLAQHIPVILSGMRDMTDSQENRALFPMRIVDTDEIDDDQEAGLVRRKGPTSNQGKENKFFFHYHPAYEPEKGGRKKFGEFLRSCDAINTQAKQIALAIASAIDKSHAEAGIVAPNLYNAISQAPTITRILRYLPRKDAGADAYIHLDRGVLSPHWFATHQGLILFDRNGAPHRVDETALDKIAMFISKKFAALFADIKDDTLCRSKYGFGVPHGVLDPRREIGMRTEDRFAVVSFVHAKLTPRAAAWLKRTAGEMEAYEKAHSL